MLRALSLAEVVQVERRDGVRVWIPGAPELSRGHGARREYAELVRAWCLDEGLPPGSAVVVEVHWPPDLTPPNLDRLARVVEEAAGVEVVEARVVVDPWKMGVFILWDGSSRAARPAAGRAWAEQLGLFGDAVSDVS